MFPVNFIYKVIPLELPIVTRNGVGYRCTEKFRTNFNGALGDVWLIYQTLKKQTWNLTIVSRKKVAEFNKNNILDQFAQNDLDTVWKYAFDHNFILNNGGQLKDGVQFTLEGPPVSEILASDLDKAELHISSEFYIPNKTRRILSEVLGISGSSAESFYKQGGFELLNNTRANRSLGKGCVVSLDVAQFRLFKNFQLGAEERNSCPTSKI